MIYSTYLGGSGSDTAAAIAVNSGGDAYITGGITSTNFPTASPVQSASGGSDAFVAKLAPAGTSLVYATYLGGSGFDYATGIAVDLLQRHRNGLHRLLRLLEPARRAGRQ